MRIVMLRLRVAKYIPGGHRVKLVGAITRVADAMRKQACSAVEGRQFKKRPELERRIHRATYYKGNVWTRRPRHRANQNETQETGIVSVETKSEFVPLQPVANITRAIVFYFRVSLYVLWYYGIYFWDAWLHLSYIYSSSREI